MKLVNTATSMCVPDSRCSARPIDDASIAQAAKPSSTKRLKARCNVTGSGVVRPVPCSAGVSVPAVGTAPTPSVPTTPQRRPSADSACAAHQAVDVLPLVPVTAITDSRSLGAP